MQTTTQESSYLQKAVDTINNEEFIGLVQLLFVTFWAVLTTLSKASILVAKQVYVWGKLVRANYEPTITKIKNKLYLATENQNNPISNFIQGYLKAEVIQPTPENNDHSTINQTEIELLVGNEPMPKHQTTNQ